MENSLLGSLREHMLDESEPLAGLLRKCLLLGAETGSDTLRDWARKELNGYGDDDVPEYRKVRGMAISMDSISGNTWARNQIVDRLQLPAEARTGVPEEFVFAQPIEELESLVGNGRLTFTSPGLAYAQMVWNQKLGPYQNIVSLTYVTAGSVVSGILGQVRTRLVDLVADLTSDTPLTELPKKEAVDAAVSDHIGDIYNTNIQTSNGPVAIGGNAMANASGLSVEDALALLDKVEQAATAVVESERAGLIDAVSALRAVVQTETPDTGEVVKKVGRLRTIAANLGVGSVVAATTGAVEAFTQLALSGAFH